MAGQTSLYQQRQGNGVVFVILVRDTWNNIIRGPAGGIFRVSIVAVCVTPQDQDTA